MSLQKRIFEQITTRHSSKAEAVDSLMSLLNVSKSSLYRKMNDKSALKPNEISLLTQYYGFSMDELIHDFSNQYLFNRLETTLPFHFEGDENPHPFQLKSAETSIAYSGSELPIYYLCYYPELMYFKKYIWRRVNVDELTNNYDLIDFSKITSQERQEYTKAIRNYEQTKSIEIWDEMILSLFVEQIKYCFNVGVLTYEDAEMLINQLSRLLNRLERMLRTGSKIPDENLNNLTVYYNPITSANWYYIIENSEIQFVQCIYDTPNMVLNTHPKLVNSVKKRYNALKQQSHLISIAGEVQRQKLLSDYRNQLEKLTLQLDL